MPSRAPTSSWVRVRAGCGAPGPDVHWSSLMVGNSDDNLAQVERGPCWPPQVRILSSTHFPACSEQLNLNLDICVNLCQLRQLCKWAMCRQLSPRSHCSLALTTSHFSRWCHSKIISVGVPQSLPTSAASTPKLGKFLIWTSRLRWICTLSSCCCLTCSRNKDSTVFPLWVLLGHDRVF